MSDSNWWFLDLAIVIAVTGGCAFGLFAGLTGVPRILLAMPLVLFLPGYALVSVLFPDDASGEHRSFDDEKTGIQNSLLVEGGLESTERFILSVVISVAMVPAIALLSSATPRGLASETVLSGLALSTVVMALLAVVSRYRCPTDQRFSLSPSRQSIFFVRSRPSPYSSTNTTPYNVAIVFGLLLLVASAGFALANPPAEEGVTEFYVETENVTGETETMYDATYAADQTQELPVAIANGAGGERTYTTVTLLQRVDIDGDSATIHETDELTRESVTVSGGDTHTQTLEITPTMTGEDLRLVLLLYEGDPADDPTIANADRVIRLPIEVT